MDDGKGTPGRFFVAGRTEASPPCQQRGFSKGFSGIGQLTVGTFTKETGDVFSQSGNNSETVAPPPS